MPPADEPVTDEPPPRGPWKRAPENPWWLLPAFGRAPPLSRRLTRVLGLVSLAMMFEQYDASMLNAALRHISSDLGMSESDLGKYTGLIRFGSIPAFLIAPLADRIGRKQMFLAALALLSLATFFSAFSQTPWQFTVLQMVSRTFITVGAAVAVVMVAEEFPAGHRGWALGIMGAISVTGQGLGAGLFAVVNHLPFGWRALYVFGAIPLLILPRLQRDLLETKRFSALAGQRAAAHSSDLAPLQPIAALVRAYPGRALGIALAGLCYGAAEIPVLQFVGYFTQTVHGWAPARFSLLVIVGGALGIAGNVVAGRLGDRIGRRPTGLLLLGAFPLAAGGLYLGPEWMVYPGWVAFVFSATGGWIILRAFSTELFPTSQRGTAMGLVSMMHALGAGAGLWGVHAMIEGGGRLPVATTYASLAMLGAAAVFLMLPETRGKELEALSKEK